MLRISDILKKVKARGKAKEQEKPQEKKTFKKSLKFDQPKPKSDTRDVKPEIQKAKPPTSASDQEKKVSPKPSLPESEASPVRIDEGTVTGVYKEAVSWAEQIMAPFIVEGEKLIKQANNLVEKNIDLLRKDADLLLRLFFQDYSVGKGYLYQHPVNVCILSLKMGLELNYNYTQLKQLGLAALLHDIGSAKFDELISQPRRLNSNEYNEIKNHPILSQDILKKFAQELNFEIFDVIRQEHERIDGSGYPYGLKGDEICADAKLIGLADVYEALLHSRPHRPKFGCLETIKMILSEKNVFEQKLIKCLINNLGIFPVGTLVKLNTKEIGIVITQTPQMPLRPVIDITHNSNEKKLEAPKRVDLAGNFAIYIKDCFVEL